LPTGVGTDMLMVGLGETPGRFCFSGA